MFAGDATVETDKQSLVLPLLGLYGELLAERLSSPAAFSSSPRRAVLEEIEANKATIFPRRLSVSVRGSRASNPLTLAGADVPDQQST